MSEHTIQRVAQIRERLQATLRRINLAELAVGILLALAVFVTLWIVSVGLEAGLWLAATPRTVIFWALLAVAAGLLGYFVVRPLLRLAGVLGSQTEASVAQRIGTQYPEVSDRLVNLLQLVDGQHSDAPSPLVDHAVRSLSAQVEPVPFEQIENFDQVRRVSRLASLPLIGLALFLLFAPSTFLDASKRLLAPGTDFARPAPFQFQTSPGDVEVVKGASVEFAFRTVGDENPLAATLFLNPLDETQADDVALVLDSTNTFRHTLINVRRSLRYRVEASGVSSPWHTVTVVERPLVQTLQLELDFPDYTRIPSQVLAPNVGNITALPGTDVDVQVSLAGSVVETAYLLFDDGTRDTLAVEGSTARGSFVHRQVGSYHVHLVSTTGVENSDPIEYALDLLTDANPSVVLLAPEPDTKLNDALTTTLRARINDDFGFLRTRLYYRLAESRFTDPQDAFTALDLPLTDRRQLDQEIVYSWIIPDATDLDLVPGDVVEYYVQVWDNDAVAGYKSATSATQRLRLPSLSEQYEELTENQDNAEDSLEDIQREAERVREQFEQLRDELRSKPEAEWEDQRQLEQLKERQQQLEESVENVANQMQDVTQQMEENNLVSDETLDKFQELQEVVQEIQSPELMDALRNLEEAMENLNMQQMQESLENFQFNEQQYQQRLERTLDLFKQLRVQQELDEAARRAEELAEQERQLAEETGELMEEQEDGEQEDGEQQDGEQQDGEQQDGEQQDGEQQDGEQQDGEQQDGEQQDGEQQDGEQQDGEQQDGEQQDGKQQDGEQQDGEQQDGEQQDGEQQDGEQQDGEQEPNERLAEEQERAAEDAEKLKELMERIQERMEELQNQRPQEQMQQLNQQMQQQDMPQQMKENAEQLRNEELQDAQQGQQQMQQQLQQMQQQMQQLNQQMQQQQQQLNMSGLRRALEDVLILSQQQEDLRTEVRGLATDSPLLRERAQRQVELSEGLSVVSDSLQSLAKEIPQMSRDVQQHAGNALREMGSATEALAERVSRRASSHQKGAMTNLNELALLLSDLLNQMMNSSQGQGGNTSMQQMMQQLQQMSEQQQQLNQQLQQMLNQMQGNRLSQDMQQRLRQMAAQQQDLRQQLRQMNRNREFRNEALGDLNKVAEQMEETIEELQQRNIGRRTIQRQQQILTRLLDATRSMQERGRENRREGQRGRNYERESPAELTPSEQAEKLRRDLLRALETGYAPDYEELIKRYFELLQQQQN